MAEDVPFDLYGDLEDAYDEADRNGDVEIVETLDTFGLWDEKPKCNHSWMHTMWRALKGDVEAQADVGHAFYWNDHDPDDIREKYKLLDKPELAIYWYKLAAEAGMSVSKFQRMFMKIIGVRPGRYIIQQRLNAACRLLESSDLGIYDIALATGFCDQSHFTKIFKSWRGMAPGAYRRRHGSCGRTVRV